MTKSVVSSLRESNNTMMAEIALLKRTIVNPASTSSQGEAFGVPTSKLKMPKSKKFEGTQCAKEVENFLWDMEAYFTHTMVKSTEKVSMTSMYLSHAPKFLCGGLNLRTIPRQGILRSRHERYSVRNCVTKPIPPLQHNMGGSRLSKKIEA